MPGQPRATIALCTYNGAQHLQAQLDSYLSQTHSNWDLWVSDDGSTDGTLDILRRFQAAQAGRHSVHILQGPGQGAAANFLSLLCHPDLPTAPTALSDQDDVWFPDKLARALRHLREGPELALYGAQSRHTNKNLKVIGGSRMPPRAPSFQNALTQNIVSGHSATLSPAALHLIRRAGPPQGIAYHDWWLYQMVTAAGGTILIDRQPVLFYRQHQENVMGAHQGIRATLLRMRQVFGQTYGGWITTNLRELQKVSDLFTRENRQTIRFLNRVPPQPGLKRSTAFLRYKIHRQTRLATVIFYLAAACGKL